MTKKKLGILLTSLVVAVTLIGGTFAWFTSTDSVDNRFKTGEADSTTPGNPNDPNAGVKIDETFNPENATNMLPGSTVIKQAKVQNTASYAQFIRVKITKNITNAEGTVIENSPLNLEYIVLNFGDNVVQTVEASSVEKWIDGNDGYYYFLGKVSISGKTINLLESVTLSTSAGNDFKNVNFEVVVNAEGIQHANGAVESWRTTDKNDNIINYLKTIE